MKKSRNQRRKIRRLILLASIVLALVTLAVVALCHVPARLTASGMRRASTLPYGLLEDSRFDSTEYTCISGFGSKQYIERSYLDPEVSPYETNTEQQLREGSMVIYTVSTWPDAVLGSSRITGIRCSDSQYTLYGCAAGDSYSDFHTALTRAGFREDPQTYAIYRKGDISVRLTLNDARTKVLYFSIDVTSSNFFGVRY